MGNNRSKVPDLEKLVKGGRKKFVRYEEGAMLYSMGVHTFQQLAKDARAVYHVKRIVLVNLDLIDEWKTVLFDGTSGIPRSGPGCYPGCLWKNGC